MSAINDIQDAIVAGKIPSEEATIITSPTLSIAVGSIGRDKLSEATFRGSNDDDDGGGLGSFTMPSQDGVLDDTLNSVNGTVISMQVSSNFNHVCLDSRANILEIAFYPQICIEK